MDKQELLDKIKNLWEKETKLIWDNYRWEAIRRILFTTDEGKEYIQILIKEEIEKEIKKKGSKEEKKPPPEPRFPPDQVFKEGKSTPEKEKDESEVGIVGEKFTLVVDACGKLSGKQANPIWVVVLVSDKDFKTWKEAMEYLEQLKAKLKRGEK